VLAEEGSTTAVTLDSLPAVPVGMERGKDEPSSHVRWLVPGWCKSPVSWLLHVCATGKTCTSFQFSSSETLEKERPGYWGMDVKTIKRDSQLPIPQVEANSALKSTGVFLMALAALEFLL